MAIPWLKSSPANQLCAILFKFRLRLTPMRSDRFDPRLLTKALSGTFAPEDQLPKFLEIMRWPQKIRCPHCRSSNIRRFYKRHRKPEGRYLHQCRACRRQFTVTTGTALHRTHVPMGKWLKAIALIRNDSARTLKPAVLMSHLGVTRKTAILMCGRLRLGMKGPFIRNLYVALRSYKKPETVYRNLFPGLHTD